MTSNRKENLWITPTKRTYDNFSKSTVRGFSHIGSRIGYSRSKVDEHGYSNITNNKRVPGKDELAR